MVLVEDEVVYWVSVVWVFFVSRYSVWWVFGKIVKLKCV